MKNFKIKYWILLIGSTLISVGCNNSGVGCFDKAGESKSVTIDVAEFTSIDVSSNIDVQLLATGSDRVELTTGKNLISGINFKVVEGVLKIENLNTCFWSIGYTHPLVKIRSIDLEKVVQHGYGNVFSKDTLVINSLSLQIEDASGSFNLLLEANAIDVVSNSLGSITLKGKSGRLGVGHYYSDGILYAKELKVGLCFIQHYGSNRMELNVENELTGLMENLGKVYLFGQNPTKIEVEITGQGEIVKMF